MEFPIIHTNFWDAVLSIPVVMILTQLIKWLSPIQRQYVPYVAVAIGLFISIFFSHPDDLLAGVFMGYFYGYSAIGSYSAATVSWQAFRKEKHAFTQYPSKNND
ncbi:hypothetical protein [Terribacillus saccharophilus]|uniref:hypothetical protein n=1 Tax=Terribacillus saccharophilus TaxID=361277 RepID=UPI003D2A62A5